MTSSQLMDSRKFVNLMNMCVSVWSRKRPKPSDNDLEEAFEPVLQYIKEQLGSIPSSQNNTPLNAPKVPKSFDAPLESNEIIHAPSMEELARQNAEPINLMLAKIDRVGKENPGPIFTVNFDRNEGMHIEALQIHLEASGLPYIIQSKTFGTPSAFVEGAPYSPGGWNVVFGRK